VNSHFSCAEISQFHLEGCMADTMLGQAPPMQSTSKPAASAPPMNISYDGHNAKVQQQSSAQSLIAMAAVKRGANWFYWIAALSVVNTIAALSGANFHFVLGLGITEVTDALRAPQARILGFFIDVLVLGFFAMCGYFGAKAHKWAFIVGMSFYLLDSGITLLLQDWLSFAFHIYALICIWRGFSHIAKTRATEQVPVLG
jgi:TRAP-type C4-dicarboxylate transport system permease small subunit